MTTAEKIAMVQVLVENDPTATNEVLAVYLALAKDAIFNRMYPFGVPASVTDIPSQYEVLQCKITMRYFLRRGAEGEKSHNENGVNRTYGSVNDEDLLAEVMQVARVV